MAKFKIGDLVIYVSTQEKGVIVDVAPPARGRQLYRVSIDNQIKNCLETNLIADIDLSDPFKRIVQGIFGSFLDFSKINTSFKIQNTSNNTISSLKASNTIFKAYQFKPLLKFLNSENRRLLVADEVGLGKTIEAGHIMLELTARRELKNALIVCPKSLVEKWQMELKEKFNFQFRIYESSNDLVDDIKGRNGTIKAIINYEKIRLPKSKEKKHPSTKINLFDLIESNDVKFDFILFDEAHRMRNHGTQTFKGAKRIIDVANAVVFLTATPIMISEQNLFNLLQLLDGNKYSEYSTFQNEIAVNAPFINALNQLKSKVEFQKIKDDLNNTSVSLFYSSGEEYQMVWNRTFAMKDLFNDIPLFNKIINDLETKKDNAETRVQLQFDLSDMSEMNKIFSRTRKKDVTQDWSQAIREPQTFIVDLYQDERQEFDKVVNDYIDEKSYIDDEGNARMSQGASLGLIQKKRQVSSSVYGYLNRTEDLNKEIDTFINAQDAKFEKLLDIIEKVVKSEKKKLIVFALFKNTLKYLNIRLKYLGIKTAIIHGDIDNRAVEIERFKTDSEVKILLSSEVGSEGLDMQFCDALVNYDLPWNPMVVEQRIGRIDRFGQMSPIVNIYNLVVKDSIQEDIYTRLLDRIGIFRGCIGDLEAILDKDLEKYENVSIRNIREWFASLEKELYCKKLTKQQRDEKIDAIELAIITEQKNLEAISEGLTDTLTNDVYFKNEIENIQNNHRYVTEKELVNYLRILIRSKLSTCQLELVNEEKLIYRIIIPQSSPRVLVNFLTEFQPVDTDAQNSFRQFITQIRDKMDIEITFSQETGYNNRSLIRINAYHPLIISAMNFFETQKSVTNNTFQFALDWNYLDKDQIQKGDYFLAVYTYTSIKKWYNREQKIELLIPILFDVERNKIINDQKLSERFLGEAQLNATANLKSNNIPKNLISPIEYLFAEEIDKIVSENISEQQMRLDTHKKMQIQRKTEFYNNRLQAQENIIKNAENRLFNSLDEKESKNIENILPAQRKVLLNLIDEKENTLTQINKSEIKYKSPQLLSLNYITVY